MSNDPTSATTRSLRWLRTGHEAYRSMLAAIDRAQHSIRLETYIYRAHGPGELFRTALVRAAARGVRVQVLLDGFGSSDLPSDYWRDLRQAGGTVLIFNPLSLRLFALRNHRKLLLVDDAIAFLGGFNIGPEYDGDGVSQGWRDLGLELCWPAALGPLAAAFDSMFRHPRIHRRLLHRLRLTAQTQLHHGRDNPVLCSGPRLIRNEFRIALMRALQRARRVQFISGYFLPSIRLRWALRRVARRGGSVELLLAGKTDVPLARSAGRSIYGSLLRAGVQIMEYQPQILHTKLAIIDDLVFVGSSNLDTRSFGINYELMVRLADPDLAAEAREIFAIDCARSVPISLRDWHASRNWRARLHGFWARFLLTKVDPWVARSQLRAMS
jgi:cardiolipin synthase